MTPSTTRLVIHTNVALKALLVLSLLIVVVNPEWGNLAGKAPLARAIGYPLVAFGIAAVWRLRGRRGPFPWLADTLVTITCFSDILGNRLDLYDSITWFDDVIHFVNTGLIGAAAVLLTLPATASLLATIERAVVVGLSGALLWEVAEYVTFVASGPEAKRAYGDTLSDLTLGWFGLIVTAIVVHRLRRRSADAAKASYDPAELSGTMGT